MHKSNEKRTWKRLLSVTGCVLCWLAAAFFAFLEWAAAAWVWKLLPDVILYGYDEAAGYNLYLAEDFWEARMCMVLFGVPFILMLALAGYWTIKLRKQGRKHEHQAPDKW